MPDRIGRVAALWLTIRQAGALATDARRLPGTAIRDRVLRLHGCLDRLIHDGILARLA